MKILRRLLLLLGDGIVGGIEFVERCLSRVEDPGQELGLELLPVGGIGHAVVSVGLNDEFFGVLGPGMDMDRVIHRDEFIVLAVDYENVGNQVEPVRQVEFQGFGELGIYASF